MIIDYLRRLKRVYGRKSEGLPTVEVEKYCKETEGDTHTLKIKPSFLETLTDIELKTLKDAMIAGRSNYDTAIRIIAKNQKTNPRYMVIQQGIMEDILRDYVRGSGLGYVGDELQMTPEKMRKFLEPLGFTEEEFPLRDIDD